MLYIDWLTVRQVEVAIAKVAQHSAAPIMLPRAGPMQGMMSCSPKRRFRDTHTPCPVRYVIDIIIYIVCILQGGERHRGA